MPFYETEIIVRFYECDSYGVVWHPNYINYFSIAKMQFLHHCKIDLQEITRLGYSIATTIFSCDIKSPSYCGDELIISLQLDDTQPTALTIFDFNIYNKKTRQLVAVGQSKEVILDSSRNLQYIIPKNLKSLFSQMYHGNTADAVL